MSIDYCGKQESFCQSCSGLTRETRRREWSLLFKDVVVEKAARMEWTVQEETCKQKWRHLPSRNAMFAVRATWIKWNILNRKHCLDETTPEKLLLSKVQPGILVKVGAIRTVLTFGSGNRGGISRWNHCKELIWIYLVKSQIFRLCAMRFHLVFQRMGYKNVYCCVDANTEKLETAQVLFKRRTVVVSFHLNRYSS